MKKTVAREVRLCDWCGGEAMYRKCCGCGKDVCWECKKKKGEEFQHGVHFSGSDDGWYCKECQRDPVVIGSSLYLAYLDIRDLRQECTRWNAEFDERRKAAEERLQVLLKRRGV